MNKSKSRKLYSWILIVGLALFASIKWGLYCHRENNLKENIGYTVGVVESLSKDTKDHGGWVYYSYTIGSQRYERSQSTGRIRTTGGQFIGKTFPLVYDEHNPSYSHLLIDPQEYAKYNVWFPDSLNWLQQYIAD